MPSSATKLYAAPARLQSKSRTREASRPFRCRPLPFAVKSTGTLAGFPRDFSDTSPSPVLAPASFSCRSRTLPRGQRQRLDPPDHGCERPPRQMALGQQEPVIARVFHQPPAGAIRCSCCPSSPACSSRSFRLLRSSSLSGTFSTIPTCSSPLPCSRLFWGSSGGGGRKFRSAFARPSTRCCNAGGTVMRGADLGACHKGRKSGFESMRESK